MNEPDHTGLPEPCMPIGCDNGFHLPGCIYSLADELDELEACDTDVREASERLDKVKTDILAAARPPDAESASAELRRAEDDLVKADAAGMQLAAQLRAAKADVEAWQANANTHLAECLRLEKLVIERTAELVSARQELDLLRKEKA